MQFATIFADLLFCTALDILKHLIFDTIGNQVSAHSSDFLNAIPGAIKGSDVAIKYKSNKN